MRNAKAREYRRECVKRGQFKGDKMVFPCAISPYGATHVSLYYLLNKRGCYSLMVIPLIDEVDYGERKRVNSANDW